jgi:rRNA maturation RNase YbeY
LEINKTFLKHNYYTDVITFNNGKKDIVAGDVMISVEQVRGNAIKYGTTFERELLRVIVHGILHLLGYTDGNKEEKKAMRILEDKCLDEFDESNRRRG